MKKAFFYLTLASLTFSTLGLKAQDIVKIPLAPSTIKIDGKLLEFGDTLANYDKSTKINYAFAHDDKNLYVFVKINGQTEQNKMMAGGLSVAINDKGKKKAVSSITFPVVDRTAMMAAMKSRGTRNRESTVQKTPEERAKEKQAMREEMLLGLKEIKIKDLKDISVESISIYNTYGIKTGISYNANNALIYEMAVPLKLVGLDAKSTDEFAINMKLNGMQMPDNGAGDNGYGGRERLGDGGFGGGREIGGGGRSYGGGGAGRQREGLDYSSLFTPTDFWVKARLN
ncbi:hypothetical protein I5M32_03290 [Pedobacter sp. SD-b]|uniref:DUF4412 domain-containing protein n=1 Tax=Pedobacter segetis TaxID=2793069 RepID=A0ABS1BGJ3_9SPHI|nr:hypothetical protein [Pedobacter segetis]MBK0381973.1 hypothetical protein [Pedobacter segetis]